MAIPLENLPDSIIYYKRKFSETDIEYEEPVLIKNVLLQLKQQAKQMYKTFNNQEVFTSATLLFIDRENSKPFLIPAIEDKIVFKFENEEKVFIVDAVIIEREPYNNSIHHLEIELR
jgi:hypothetical protein